MPWPHGPLCACPQPPSDGGLLLYTISCEHHAELARALNRIAERDEVTLRVLTTGPEPDNLVQLLADGPRCDGSMVCECARCAADRSARVRRGVRPSQPLPIKQRKAA